MLYAYLLHDDGMIRVDRVSLLQALRRKFGLTVQECYQQYIDRRRPICLDIEIDGKEISGSFVIGIPFPNIRAKLFDMEEETR